jgi:hypothetical protein
LLWRVFPQGKTARVRPRHCSRVIEAVPDFDFDADFVLLRMIDDDDDCGVKDKTVELADVELLA